MSALAADGALMRTIDAASFNAAGNAEVVARLERLPVTSRLKLLRVIVGVATFFDAYTVLAIAFAMPQLVSEWKLTPTEVGLIISAGYVGQLFGAVVLRIARREDRSLEDTLHHCRAVYVDGRRLPVRLERRVDDGPSASFRGSVRAERCRWRVLTSMSLSVPKSVDVSSCSTRSSFRSA